MSRVYGGRPLAHWAAAAWLAAGIATGLLLASPGAHASDPGSKDDPLVTMGYVKGLAQYKRVDIAAGRSLRLGSGAEMVVVEPSFQALDVKGLDTQKSGLLNLSNGERVGTGSLAANQLYVNSAAADQFLKFGAAATLLLRGDWQ